MYTLIWSKLILFFYYITVYMKCFYWILCILVGNDQKAGLTKSKQKTSGVRESGGGGHPGTQLLEQSDSSCLLCVSLHTKRSCLFFPHFCFEAQHKCSGWQAVHSSRYHFSGCGSVWSCNVIIVTGQLCNVNSSVRCGISIYISGTWNMSL